MAEAVRIDCEEARAKVQANEALLVCAYDSDKEFNKNHLDGAISFAVFREMVPSLAKDKEIIFYCA